MIPDTDAALKGECLEKLQLRTILETNSAP